MGETPSDTIDVSDRGDRTVVAVASSNPFVLPGYDEEDHPPTLDTVIKSSRRVEGLTLMVGKKENGEPVRQLIGTPLPWDGLSEEQAYYLNVNPGLPAGKYDLTIADVPDGASWSITAYTKDGLSEPNEPHMYNVNSVTATPNDDGSVTVHFGACGDDCLNSLPITEGWSYIVRLHQAHRKP
ncbi:MAG: DUF1214 domain-containing protein [Actinomycetota bacterium]|nr:DUF1214 domain-containing protein [Actinomycetota bacterium]